jgi:carboxypeptidase Taq
MGAASSAADAYAELIRREKEAALLGSCASLLDWDHQTYMPPKGAAHRAEQLGLLAALVHRQATAPEIGECLAAVEGSDLVLDPAAPAASAAVNVREIRRSYDRAVRLPEALVRELAEVTAMAHDVWAEARRASDFARFRPWLEKIVGLKRQEAEALGYTTGPFDALLEDYEPGETTARLIPIFQELRDALVPLVAAIQETGRRPDPSSLTREYPVGAQERFGRMVATAFGFDFAAGRLDVTTHPFCSGIGPGDTRLTTRYNPGDFGDAFFSIAHETGHGLYDQGLDPAHYGTPMGSAVSLGIHESQSRLWENFVARSRSFWEFAFPAAQAAFPQALAGVGLNAFHWAINEVRPSFIRVDADEATYNLHILLRFELERALLAGELAVADLPAAWNERFAQLLGLTPPDDAQGCLQDVHWSSGGFGYFPTYMLGNLYAAQFFAQARRELGDLDAAFRRGEFAPLHAWLAAKIYRQGQRYRAPDLAIAVTGRPLSAKPLLDHLRTKFGELYQLGG